MTLIILGADQIVGDNAAPEEAAPPTPLPLAAGQQLSSLTERAARGVAQVPGETGNSLSQSTGGVEPRRAEYAGVVAPPAGRDAPVDAARSVSEQLSLIPTGYERAAA